MSAWQQAQGRFPIDGEERIAAEHAELQRGWFWRIAFVGTTLFVAATAAAAVLA